MTVKRSKKEMIDSTYEKKKRKEETESKKGGDKSVVRMGRK